MRFTQIEITKAGTENPLSVLKRFTKRVSGSGILRKVRSRRYHVRTKSELARKKDALRRIKNRAERERLWKLGKLEDVRRR